jgi:hypothetical protein
MQDNFVFFPLKAARVARNRSSIMHAVSYFAGGVNNISCIPFFAWQSRFAYDFHFFLHDECGVDAKYMQKIRIFFEFEFIFEKALDP